MRPYSAGILQEACGRSEFWRLVDKRGRAPGVIGLWPGRAVTFLDNHDTGSTQAHWPFPSDKVGRCRLTPGTPWFSQLTSRLLSGTFSS